MDPVDPVKFSPSWHLCCILLRGPMPVPATKAALEFLTLRNCEISVCSFTMTLLGQFVYIDKLIQRYMDEQETVLAFKELLV